MSGYDVDLDELESVVAELVGCEDALARLGGDLERRLSLLHRQWAGQAAIAHAGAHQRWQSSLARLHVALGDLRAVGARAHHNYTAATTANLMLWQALR